LNNSGTIRPGTAGTVGTLTISGNLTNTGAVDIDLGGIGVGQSDKLAVTGNVTMGGTLNASLIGGYTPTFGDAIPFLTMGGTATGTFGTTNLPVNFAAGYNLAAGEGSRLIYSGFGTRTFTNAGGGLNWGTATNWSGNVLPGSGDEALISSGYAVAHTTGTDTVGALHQQWPQLPHRIGRFFDGTGSHQCGRYAECIRHRCCHPEWRA